MFDDVIKFQGRESDLEPMPEFWQTDTYEERYNQIIDSIVKLRGFLPSIRMQPIREGVFRVQDDTRLKDIVELTKRIKKYYMIDCFQVSIDRETNMAHLLFDWNRRDAGKSIFMNRSQHIAMSVMILCSLNLPRPEGTELWLRYFFMREYDDNPEIFDDVLNHLKHAHLGKRSYRIAYDAITYMRQKCQGLVK